MSWNNFGAHLYGVAISGLSIRDELWEEYDDDPVELFNELMDGLYPDDFPENGKSVDIFSGPDSDWYIGYGAVMPYSDFRITKEEANANIEAILKYLLGAKYNPKEYKPDDIFDVWSE